MEAQQPQSRRQLYARYGARSTLNPSLSQATRHRQRLSSPLPLPRLILCIIDVDVLLQRSFRNRHRRGAPKNLPSPSEACTSTCSSYPVTRSKCRSNASRSVIFVAQPCILPAPTRQRALLVLTGTRNKSSSRPRHHDGHNSSKILSSRISEPMPTATRQPRSADLESADAPHTGSRFGPKFHQGCACSALRQRLGPAFFPSRQMVPDFSTIAPHDTRTCCNNTRVLPCLGLAHLNTYISASSWPCRSTYPNGALCLASHPRGPLSMRLGCLLLFHISNLSDQQSLRSQLIVSTLAPILHSCGGGSTSRLSVSLTYHTLWSCRHAIAREPAAQSERAERSCTIRPAVARHAGGVASIASKTAVPSSAPEFGSFASLPVSHPADAVSSRRPCSRAFLTFLATQQSILYLQAAVVPRFFASFVEDMSEVAATKRRLSVPWVNIFPH